MWGRLLFYQYRRYNDGTKAYFTCCYGIDAIQIADCEQRYDRCHKKNTETRSSTLQSTKTSAGRFFQTVVGFKYSWYFTCMYSLLPCLRIHKKGIFSGGFQGKSARNSQLGWTGGLNCLYWRLRGYFRPRVDQRICSN